MMLNKYRAIPLDEICTQHRARDRARVSRNQTSSDIIAVVCFTWERMKRYSTIDELEIALLYWNVTRNISGRFSSSCETSQALPRADTSTRLLSILHELWHNRGSSITALAWAKALITGYYPLHCVISRDSDLEASADAFKLTCLK
jgi:hypothetical protein